jgi:hypothetical protein
MLRFDTGADELPADGSDALATLTVTGAVRGRGAQSYQLRYRPDTNAVDDSRPLLPYLGRSARNNPIVLTSAGPLELTDSAPDLARGLESVYVIDETHKRLVAEYVFMDEGPIVTFEDGDGWIIRDKRCIAAPKALPGRLRSDGNVCFDPKASVDLSLPLPESDYLPATAALLAELSAVVPSIAEDGFQPTSGRPKEYGGSGAVLRVFRLRNTSFLVAHIVCTDCN